jgi:hypothetical protein
LTNTRACAIITSESKRKGDKKMKKYVITYRSFKTYRDKEVYTEKAIAERRFNSLMECENADNVKMEIRED